MAKNGPVIQAITGIVSGIGDAIEEKKNAKSYVVYKLVDEKTEKVEYVGRTKDPVTRAEAHARDGKRTHLTFSIIEGGH